MNTMPNMSGQTGAALCAALCLAGCALTAPGPVGPGAPGGATTAGAATANAPGGYVWSRSMEAKRTALDKAVAGTGISVLRTKDNQLQVNVPSEFSFDTDSAAITPGMRPVLDEFAQDLNIPLLSRMVVLVVGHTDSRGSLAVNDALSLARATRVGRYLESKGISSGRIAVEGRGERQPLVDSTQNYGLALNRRVEMFLRETPQ